MSRFAARQETPANALSTHRPSTSPYRDEEVFLYRMRTPPESARRLFEVYLERINELADRPEG